MAIDRIAVEGAESDRRTAPRVRRTHWSWVVLCGVVVGAFAAPPPPGALPTEPVIVEPFLAHGIAVLDPDPPAPLVLMPAPLDERNTGAVLTTIADGTVSTRRLDRSVSTGIGQGVIGADGVRLRLIDDDLVFVSLGDVIVQPVSRPAQPLLDIGDGVYLLPGDGAAGLWIVGSGSRWVSRVDLERLVVGSRYRLDTIGRPLASMDRGLLLSTNDAVGYGIWNPHGEFERLELEAGLGFLSASATTILFSNDGRLVVHDLETGATHETGVRTTSSRGRLSFIPSPDGALVAVGFPTTLTQLPRVEVIDIGTGSLVTEIDPAASHQLQWVSPSQILFLDPTGGEYALSIADVDSGSRTRTVELPGSSFWFAGQSVDG